MEVITIESEAFRELVRKIDAIEKYIASKDDRQSDLAGMWVDSNDVCDVLNISTRTLQRLRSKRAITYSIIGGKTYYTIDEIRRVLQQRLIRRSEECIDQLIVHYNSPHKKLPLK